MCRVWAIVVVVAALAAPQQAKQRIHRGINDLTSSSRLDNLLHRLDTNIQQQTKRLERGLPLHYLENELEPTVVEAAPWGDMTQPEYWPNDVQPWTRTRQDRARPTLAPNDLQIVKLASDYARLVKTSAKCEVPLRRCLPVASLHPDAAFKYWPRCALLHRCGDDAGCCNDVSNSCKMEESENVDLYFYVYTSGGNGRAGVQRLTFRNDTKCSCQPGQPTPAAPTSPPVTCQCPKQFEGVSEGGGCACRCGDDNRRCKKYARGKRFFSATDVRCMTSGECTAPSCDYGEFLEEQHRCPRKHERARYTVSRRK